LFIGFSKISEAYVRKIKCRHKIPHGRNKTVIYGWHRGCLKCMPYAFTKNDSTYGPNVRQNRCGHGSNKYVSKSPVSASYIS
jgi:hypothetical protein